jgi:hypothetical protein
VAISQGTVILFLTSSWYMLNNTSCAFLTIRNSNIWNKLLECTVGKLHMGLYVRQDFETYFAADG